MSFSKKCADCGTKVRHAVIEFGKPEVSWCGPCWMAYLTDVEASTQEYPFLPYKKK